MRPMDINYTVYDVISTDHIPHYLTLNQSVMNTAGDGMQAAANNTYGEVNYDSLDFIAFMCYSLVTLIATLGNLAVILVILRKRFD